MSLQEQYNKLTELQEDITKVEKYLRVAKRAGEIETAVALSKLLDIIQNQYDEVVLYEFR